MLQASKGPAIGNGAGCPVSPAYVVPPLSNSDVSNLPPGHICSAAPRRSSASARRWTQRCRGLVCERYDVAIIAHGGGVRTLLLF